MDLKQRVVAAREAASNQTQIYAATQHRFTTVWKNYNSDLNRFETVCGSCERSSDQGIQAETPRKRASKWYCNTLQHTA